MMRHLHGADLIDAAEGAASAAAQAHLAECDLCRIRLSELRRTVGVAAEDDVPEPSPLFWDHLSSRVREAIEATPERGRRQRAWRRMAPVATLLAGAVAAAVLVIGMNTRTRPVPSASESHRPVAADVAGSDSGDAPLAIISDMLADVDATTDVETAVGTAVRPGDVERIVTTLSPAERSELARLIRQEMAHRGEGG